MKLKKIASLMLAGIMAVSMLAACGEGKKDDSSSSSSSQVATSNAATYANAQLSSSQKKIFEFVNDDTLNAALKSATSDYSKVTSKMISDTYNKTTVDGGYNQLKDLNDAVMDKLGRNDFKILNNNPKDGWQSKLTTEGMSKFAVSYMVSGKLNEEGAIAAVVDTFDGAASPYAVQDDFYPLSTSNLKADYNAAISVVKMTNAEKASESAWVVTIVVTQTVTKVA